MTELSGWSIRTSAAISIRYVDDAHAAHKTPLAQLSCQGYVALAHCSSHTDVPSTSMLNFTHSHRLALLQVYMCRMLDDLWTRFTVKSRWMDETAGGCTNFISWRHNNQWLLNINRPQTKLIIKLTQPDARKEAGHGRHYTNAIGFYILKVC